MRITSCFRLSLILWITLFSFSATILAANDEKDLAQRCESEVVELHQFFQDWFNGVLEPTDADFARFADALAPDFVIIPPSGRAVERDPLLQGLKQAHGRWREGETIGKGRIWIQDFTIRLIESQVLVATYEEWQEFKREVKSRVSTVIFRAAEGTPNGVNWHHLQETNLP